MSSACESQENASIGTRVDENQDDNIIQKAGEGVGSSVKESNRPNNESRWIVKTDAARRERGSQEKLAKYLKVHPKGFKVLTKTSAIERSLKTYFRLPPPVPTQLVNDLKKVSDRLNAQARHTATQKKTILDGFLLLKITGVDDPMEASEANLTSLKLQGVIAEDLKYFSSICFIESGENSLNLKDFENFENLEELHLHCNGITSHSLDFTKGSFVTLDTLNLAYNNICGEDINSLKPLPRLARLDLSGNPLLKLPRDLSQLDTLVQVAMERAGLDNCAVAALATLPNIEELNVNYNHISIIDVPQTGCLSKLRILGLAGNPVRRCNALTSLLSLSSLRRIVLWSTPVEQSPTVKEVIFTMFQRQQVVVEFSNPVRSAKSISSFYDPKAIVKITNEQDDCGYRVRAKAKHVYNSMIKPPRIPTPPVPIDERNDRSFFLTEGGCVTPETNSVVEGENTVVSSKCDFEEDLDTDEICINPIDKHIQQVMGLPRITSQRTRTILTETDSGLSKKSLSFPTPLPTLGAAFVELRRALKVSVTFPISQGIRKRPKKKKSTIASQSCVVPLPPLPVGPLGC